MIYLIHENNKALRVLDNNLNVLQFKGVSNTVEALFMLAKKFPSEIIVWSHAKYFEYLNIEEIGKIFHHKRILASFSVNEQSYIPDAIGFVDQSVYIKVNRQVTYPTWLMSSDVGGLHAEVLNTTLKDTKKYKCFNYFINAIAKKAMPQGLFCYSEPKLLSTVSSNTFKTEVASSYEFFKFVKEHYKSFWVFILFFAGLRYAKKFPLIPFLRCLCYGQQKEILDFSEIPIDSLHKVVEEKTIDVVIPTIGRKNYLFDVLKDLSKQTILPKNVIIIEQNPNEKSVSDLDYLTTENWPFKIKHKFIHQSGVCNARNLGMSLVKSAWTFLGDDDNRFAPDLIERVFQEIESVGAKAISTVYLKPNEKQTYLKTSQTSIFGGGNSFIKSNLLKHLKFDLSYEFNYGEDSDFGMQIRHLGEDIIFCSNLKITHLKAPIGGYRIKVEHPWVNEPVLPKPSPTIMLFNLKYFTNKQLLTYKLLLFIRFYKHQNIKNPIRYISEMKKSWKVSKFWAEKLIQKTDA